MRLKRCSPHKSFPYNLLENEVLERAARQIRQLTTVYPKEYSLLELASKARSAEATDPRDRVFALLGLAKDTKGLRSNYSENPATLQIDYRSSVKSVCIGVAGAIILSDELQEVLAEARHRYLSSQELPSWVPDWRVQKRGNDISENSDPERSSAYRRRARTHFRASHLFRASARLDENGTLMLQGTRIDNITNKTDILPMMSGNENF